MNTIIIQPRTQMEAMLIDTFLKGLKIKAKVVENKSFGELEEMIEKGELDLKPTKSKTYKDVKKALSEVNEGKARFIKTINE